MDSKSAALLELVKWGLGHNGGVPFPNDIASGVGDWEELRLFANRQHVLAVAYDGIDLTYQSGTDLQIPRDVLRKWYGNTLKYTEKYDANCRILTSLAHFYNSNGIRMMLLKGYGLGLDYPNPEHRPIGDIDIYLFGRQKEADRLINEKHKVKIDNSHSIHSVFHVNGTTVENHYDFFNVTAHPSNREINDILKQEAESSQTLSITVGDEKIFIPGPDFNAIYLLRHTAQHFAAIEINLRHLIDWGTFVKAHGKEVDWKLLTERARHFNMDRFLAVQNAILHDYLGFDAGIFPEMEVDRELEEKVLNEILEPSFKLQHPKNIFSILVWKWRRWRANAWKNEIVYNEGQIRTFFSQMLSHIAKPGTFRI